MSDSFLRPISVNSRFAQYEVSFSKLIDLKFPEEYIVIIDSASFVLERVKSIIESKMILIEASENEKNMQTVTKTLELIAEAGATKKTQLLAFGGGVVQDLATLTSSLYMRGIDWIYIPTTLMSAMDSCIGGKSSINLAKYKNIVGNFYPPKKVFIDSDFFSSLSKPAISSGVAEGAKICFARGNHEFREFCSYVADWRLTGDRKALNMAIFNSLSAKQWFIEVDEFDLNQRKLLNFGHTFGHALEAATSFIVPHGIAILLGMKAAIIESSNRENCADLWEFIDCELAFSGWRGSRIKLSESIFCEALARDKKNTRTTQVLILPNSAGNLEVIQRPLNTDSIYSCFHSMKESLKDSEVLLEVF